MTTKKGSKCPNCGRTYQHKIYRCGCGFNLVTRKMELQERLAEEYDGAEP
jgi:hypothetical protein